MNFKVLPWVQLTSLWSILVAVVVVCLLDFDHDELNNVSELFWGSNPLKLDTDGDGFYDGLETRHAFLNPAVWNNPDYDQDKDGMSNLNEAIYRLCMEYDDSRLDPDHDGLTNLEEFKFGSSPVDADIDHDELNDAQEKAAGTDPWKYDTDGDGLTDAWELRYDLNPLVAQAPETDTDDDGLVDLQEERWGTDPQNPDTDRDGVNDGQEVRNGTGSTDPEWGGAPPAAPSELVEKKNRDGSITFTWKNNATNAESLHLRIKQSDGTWLLIANLPPDATTYTYYPPGVPKPLRK